MNDFHVISPNVDGEGINVNDFLTQMKEHHEILMGWGDDHSGGSMFKSMKKGDYVICARGANMRKNVYFAGKISSDTFGHGPYSRKISGFVDLSNIFGLFSEENAYGASSQIPSIYKLKTSNKADKKYCPFDFCPYYFKRQGRAADYWKTKKADRLHK